MTWTSYWPNRSFESRLRPDPNLSFATEARLLSWARGRWPGLSRCFLFWISFLINLRSDPRTDDDLGCLDPTLDLVSRPPRPQTSNSWVKLSGSSESSSWSSSSWSSPHNSWSTVIRHPEPGLERRKERNTWALSLTDTVARKTRLES